MDDIKDIVLRYLEPTLGKAKISYKQVKWNCPLCNAGQKYNLEVNILTGAMHCWACGYSGYITKLLKDYAVDSSWKSLEIFKNKSYSKKQVKKESKVLFPVNTIPFYHNKAVNDYLTKERGIDDLLLYKRNVRYCFDPENPFYNHILFPYYDRERTIHAFTAQNFATKKYKNIGSTNFVVYKEFINTYFPIILTEGIYDSLSVPNAIPLLGTNIFQSVLRYCQDKKIILALDNDKEVSIDYKKQLIKKLYTYGAKIVVSFELDKYKDLNDFWVKDRQEMKDKVRILFELLLNNV